MALLVLLACLQEQPIAEDSGTLTDEDGDGWGANEDCDDDDPAVHPDADEVCNGVDDNCDDVVDEDALDRETFYRDADGDRFGTSEETTLACEPADGWVDNDLDCDDDSDLVYPGADEICDYLDNDCDGETDEDGLTWYYTDADGDSYGDEQDAGEETCGVPEGKVADNTDCDDADPEVNPDADEVCNGLDDDCDGLVDPDTSLDAPTWYIDADSDGHGSADYTLTQCEQPDGYVAAASDCDDLDEEVNPDADEVCNEVDDDCDGDVDEDDAVDAPTWYGDGDGDGHGDDGDTKVQCEQPSGYVSTGGDCDDGASGVNPDANELCNDEDDDCDGDVDEEATDALTWFADTDGDGHGDSGTTTTACDQPTGYVGSSRDCDDADADTNPDADETCDGHDDDCDGDVDEDDAVDADTWYGDDDGDGYGEDADTTTACDQPSGYEAIGGDCDDGDDDIFPGADEVCNEEDDDCDGDVDEDDAIDATTWYADSDGDSYGDSASTTVACDEPSGYVSDDTDCDDAESAVNPGETEVCGDGLDNDCDGAIGDDCGPYGTVQMAYADAKITGEDASDYFGFSVDAGDIDGDGYGDIVVGAPYASSGTAYVVYGPLTADVDASAADLTIEGSTYYALEVQVVGDLDSDGVDDLAVASQQASTVATGDADPVYNHGLVSIFYGPGTGSLKAEHADIWLTGDDSFDFFGTRVADLGDMDGDGVDDLVVGSAYNSTGASYGGLAAIYYGPLTADLEGEPAERLEGTTTNGYLGASVVGVDANGDGTPDLLAGALGEDAAYIAYGPLTSAVSDTDADVLLSGASNDYTGRALASPGDLDGDGYDELVVGSPYYNSYAGYAWILNGPVTADATLASDYDVRLVGPSSGYGGYTLTACDVDGDGTHDVVVGAPGTGTWKGKAYLHLGPISSGSYVMSSTAEGTLAGEGTYEYLSYNDGLGCADVDADGNDDIVVGAYGNDDGGSNAGAAYLVLGGAGL